MGIRGVDPERKNGVEAFFDAFRLIKRTDVISAFFFRHTRFYESGGFFHTGVIDPGGFPHFFFFIFILDGTDVIHTGGGIVELGDDVDVGANTTIDRARFGRTIVGEGTKIDNLIQLGHNVVVGRHCIIVAQSGIAGSTKVGDYATIAAQVGISGHLNIGSKSTLGAKTGVLSDIPENSTYWGMPAFPYKDATRQYAALKKLPALIKEVRALKKELDSSGK